MKHENTSVNIAKAVFLFQVYLLVLVLGTFTGTSAVADVIVDDGDPGTSYTGTWAASGGANPYSPEDPDATSLWSRNGATYTWSFAYEPAGIYEVLMWWTGYSSRTSSAPVDIEHGNGTSTVLINQKQNAGQWNSLGEYYFNGIGNVVLTASDGSSVSTSADAVWFRLVNDGTQPVIIDNNDPQTSSTGTWAVSGETSQYATDSLSATDEATFTWLFTPPMGGTYQVSMWWSEGENHSLAVPVQIQHAEGTVETTVDQTTSPGVWNSLGSYTFLAGNTYALVITADLAPTVTCADAVQFVRLNEPFLRITQPLSYYLQTSQTLDANVFTTGMSPDWGVKFILDFETAQEQQATDYTLPFSATFNQVALAEHTLDALIIDADGIPIVDGEPSDLSVRVGIGDYYIGFGDSITSGFGDDDNSDNMSLDSRNLSAGYTPVLNNILTAWRNYPHTVIGEGVGGETAEEGAARITSVIERHPNAQRYLILYGTNDSKQNYPSGLGLSPNMAGYAGSFKHYMQQIVDAILAAGCQPCLTKIPITLGESHDQNPFPNPDEAPRNNLIKAYNEVIDELTNDPANGIDTTPPDLYSFFLSEDPSTGQPRYESLYVDNYHPNGEGYRALADQWLLSLSAPKAQILAITPNPATPGALVSFQGAGYSLANDISQYLWVSDLDGDLSNQASFETDQLSAGAHIISLQVQDDGGNWSVAVSRALTISDAVEDIIIDNLDPSTSASGEWKVSGGPEPYGADSFWSRGGTTFSWLFTPPDDGMYDTFIWWTEWSSRSPSVELIINQADGISYRTLNQQVGGGQWNNLGSFRFSAGNTYEITLVSPPSPYSGSADAVRFTYLGSASTDSWIIDNGSDNTSSTGTWSVSGGADPYGADSYWSRNGTTYTYTFTPGESKYYSLDMWWTEWSSRSQSVAVDIIHAQGTNRVYVNQQNGGRQWNNLGTYPLEAGIPCQVTITSSPGPSSTSADAVRFTDTGQDFTP